MNVAVFVAGALAWGFFLWLTYLAGQSIHIWLRASLAINSGLNSVATYKQYLRLKGPVLVARLFLETLAFMLFEYGVGAQTWFSLPSGGSPIVKVAIAGFFGYAGDSLLDQFFAKIGLDKELPPKVD